MYGSRTGAQMYKKIIRGFKPFVPSLGSKRYKTIEQLLETAGWHKISVEYFYLFKLMLSATCFMIMFFVTLSNQHIQVDAIFRNINLGRDTTSLRLETTEERVQLEELIYSTVMNAYEKGTISNADDIKILVDHLLTTANIQASESVDEITERMILKASIIHSIQTDVFSYIKILIFMIFAFFIPDILAYIKMSLLENAKTWDAVYCMVIYSVFGRIPPYRVDLVLNNMEDVVEFYKPKLSAFKQILSKNNTLEIEEFLKTIGNDDLQEVLEMLYISRRTGLLDTVRDIEEMYESSIEWMDISNKKRRQFKFSLCLIPLSIIFLLSIVYFQFGLIEIMNTGINI